MQHQTPAVGLGWHDPKSLRANNLDFLRFALATLVILSHSFALLSGSDATEPLDRLTGHQVTFGALAVDAFFVISGLLITHSWLRTDRAPAFFKKRALRIYPAFIVAVLFGALIVAPLGSAPASAWMSRHQAVHLAKCLVALLPYQCPPAFASLPVHAINGSLWTIRFEFYCYIGVAICGAAGLLTATARRLTALFAAAIAVSLIFLILDLHPNATFLSTLLGDPRSWSRLLPYYLAGMCFYLLRHRIPFSTPLAITSAALVAAGALLPHGLALALPTAGTYLLFWTAFHPSLPLHNWARYGDFSYGIYLYAFPIQQLILLHSGPSTAPLTLFLYSFPLSLAAGVISWYAVERHFLRRKPTAKAPAAQTTPEPALVNA